MTQNDLEDKETQGVEELRHRLKGDAHADTGMFLRFFRARNHDINAAEQMLRNHVNWRKLHRTDSFLEWYKPHEVLSKFIPFSPMGYDHEGSPIRYSNFGGFDIRGCLKCVKLSEYTNYVIGMLEEDATKLKEQSKKLNEDVDKWIHVLNFENFPLSIATHKPSLEAVGRMISLYEANYPERLKQAYVINASWFFQLGFAIIKPLLSGPTLKKVKIFGKDGWQEELRNLMDPDELPAFLGGNKTDADGDPMCRTFIKHGGLVPEMYYAVNKRVPLSTQPGVKRVCISRLSKLQIELMVLYPGSEIEWEFETKGKDIAYTLLYKEDKSGEPVELLPRQRAETSIASESGLYRCDRAGIYYLEFDNTYSWLSPKEVFYRVKVSNPHNKSKGA